MPKIFSLSLILLTLSLSAFSQHDSIRVLFLGNSYTGVNNLPMITQNLASEAKKTLLTDSNTPGGYTLEEHSTNPTSLAKIRQGNWDFVVLQEQSQIPTIDFYRYNSMYPGAERLNDSIKKYNPCAKTTLYMTWGRRFGGQQCDGSGTNCSPVFVDFSHMQDSLESAYVEIANAIDAYVAPVGIAWKNVIEDTAIVLHSSDNSHPNYSGSYLAACVFHAIFWNESPLGLSFIGTLSPPLAAYLQEVADSTVFHSYSTWNLDLHNVTAHFSFSTFGDSVQFANLSQSLAPVSYFWDFGDGNSSHAESPSHRYGLNQTYIVSLIVEHCSIRDTFSQTLNINTTGIVQPDFRSLIQIFPNPVDTDVEISLHKTFPNLRAELMDVTGKVVGSYDLSDQQHVKIPLGFLAGGVYLLKLEDKKGHEQAVFRIVKK